MIVNTGVEAGVRGFFRHPGMQAWHQCAGVVMIVRCSFEQTADYTFTGICSILGDLRSLTKKDGVRRKVVIGCLAEL